MGGREAGVTPSLARSILVSKQSTESRGCRLHEALQLRKGGHQRPPRLDSMQTSQFFRLETPRREKSLQKKTRWVFDLPGMIGGGTMFISIHLLIFIFLTFYFILEYS